MNKYRIVIASVLKPVTEPRAFTKLALSMLETNKYHINIIGFCSKKHVKTSGIHFSPIFCRTRTHLLRLFVPFKFLSRLITYRPDAVIVTTYELLPMAILARTVLGFKLIYDLQENYSHNFLLNRSSHRMLRQLAAFLIRSIEKLAHPLVDHYFFAEQIYQHQFPEITRYTVLENKYAGPVGPLPKTPRSKEPLLLISGTITPVYGIEKAIHWFLSLRESFPLARLHILGHVPLTDFQTRLEKLSFDRPEISLNISSRPLDYTEILEAVQQADVVLLPYEPLDSIRFKIPSKLYESVALHKPLLISKNPLWEEIIQAYPAGLAVDFSKSHDAAKVFRELLDLPLYQTTPGVEVHWEGEKPKLNRILQQLLD